MTLDYVAYGDFGGEPPGSEIPVASLLNAPASYGACVLQEQICLRQHRLASLSERDFVQPLEADIASLQAAMPSS